jgi:hypothetical protein
MSDVAHYRTQGNIEAARRNGGAEFGASIAGMFAALGLLTFIGALVAAGANQLDYQLNLIDLEGELLELSAVGALVALVAVFLAFVFGGWVAGRIARYEGAKHGMGSGLWLLVLAGIFALLGALVGPEYNAFGPAGLPDWFSAIRSDVRTGGSILILAAAILAVLGGGYVGGRLGETFHRKADDAVVVAATREDQLH